MSQLCADVGHMKRLEVLLLILCIASCTQTTSGRDSRQPEQRGFFQRLGEHLTERECNVGRFTCPYGFGPAGEPCDCTDPSGVVVGGRTVK